MIRRGTRTTFAVIFSVCTVAVSVKNCPNHNNCPSEKDIGYCSTITELVTTCFHEKTNFEFSKKGNIFFGQNSSFLAIVFASIRLPLVRETSEIVRP